MSEVTAYISTRNRYYSTLPLAVNSVVAQIRPPDRFIIFDDGEQKDLRSDPLYVHIFGLLDEKRIKWEVLFGQKKGQVTNHQKVLEISGTEWIWRLDDDNIAEPNVLEVLLKNVDGQVGAIGSTIFVPKMNGSPLPQFVTGKIEDINLYNPQWFRFKGVMDVEHLHNSFLYRRKAATHGYQMDLSPVGHREETLFTYGIKRNGWKLLVCGDCITWHLRYNSGGIRTQTIHNNENFAHDEEIFREKLKSYKVKLDDVKLVILDSGLGDHLAFKNILPELQKRHDRVIIGACYPQVFKDDDVRIININEASLMDNKDRHNIYKWMWDRNWNKSIVDAYREMYL